MIASLAKRDTVFGAKAEFIEVRHPIFYGKFLDRLKNHIDHAPIILENSCCRYSLKEDINVLPEAVLILLSRILVIDSTHM